MKPGNNNSKGIQAVLTGAGSAATMIGTVATGVEGKPKLALVALSSVLALIAAFSHPPTK